MDEGEFSLHWRNHLRRTGLVVLCVWEADERGVSDLVILDPSHKVLAWAELKVNDEALRPSQVEFLRARDRECGNAFVVRYHGATGLVMVERPKTADGWSTDRKKLAMIHSTARWAIDFDWAAAFNRWKRPKQKLG